MSRPGHIAPPAKPTGLRASRWRQYRRNMARAYPDAPAQLAQAERGRVLRRLAVYVVGKAVAVFCLAALLGLATGLRCGAGR